MEPNRCKGTQSPWQPTEAAQTPPSRRSSSRLHIGVIVITPHSGATPTSPKSDQQRRPCRSGTARLKPAKAKHVAPRAGENSPDSDDELRRGDARDPRRRRTSPGPPLASHCTPPKRRPLKNMAAPIPQQRKTNMEETRTRRTKPTNKVLPRQTITLQSHRCHESHHTEHGENVGTNH
jgi:hypothetical protein